MSRSPALKARNPESQTLPMSTLRKSVEAWSDASTESLISPGFTRLAPKVETNQTLAELADLLDTQSCPANQDDAAAVERDIIHILRLTGPMAALKHPKPGSRGHCLISPLEALEAVYKYWKANLGMFVKLTLLPPEEGWLAKFDSSQVNLPKNTDCAAKDLGF